MRKLRRDTSCYGLIDGFEEEIGKISKFCFVSDIESNNREYFYCCKSKKYENTFYIDEELKKLFDNGIVQENEILFLGEYKSLRECFFYLDTELDPPYVGSLIQKGIHTLDCIHLALKNEFSNSIAKIHSDTKHKLTSVVKEMNELKNKDLDERSYLDFVRSFLFFLEDMTNSPLVSVSSTIILNSENYKSLEDFVLYHIKLATDDETKIRSKINKYKEILIENQMFSKKEHLLSEITHYLDIYDYKEAIKCVEKFGEFKILQSVLKYAFDLFDNSSSFNWRKEHYLLQDILLKKQLGEGIVDFENLFIRNDESILWDIKRKISKAQIYFSKGKHTQLIEVVQKFMESYLKAVGAAEKYSTQKKALVPIVAISEKMKKAYEDTDKMKSLLHYKIINSFLICFDENEQSQIKKMNKDFEPIKYARNKYSHDDVGVSDDDITGKLLYVFEEELGMKEFTGHFHKWIEWFHLPERNIFDQINDRIKQLLEKPDLLFDEKQNGI